MLPCSAGSAKRGAVGGFGRRRGRSCADRDRIPVAFFIQIPEPVTSRIAEEMPPAESPEIDRTARTRPAMGSANRSQKRISKFPGDCVWRHESASDEFMGTPLFGPLRTLASSISR